MSGFHEARLARRLKNPEFRAEYERQLELMRGEGLMGIYDQDDDEGMGMEQAPHWVVRATGAVLIAVIVGLAIAVVVGLVLG